MLMFLGALFVVIERRHQQGVYGLVCDEEASAHYGLVVKGLSGTLWRSRVYARGFLKK